MPALLGKMADSNSGIGNRKDKPGHPVPESNGRAVNS